MGPNSFRRPLACLAAGTLAAAALAVTTPPSTGADAAAPSAPTAIEVSLDGDGGPPTVAGRPDPASLIREAGGLSEEALGDIFRAHVVRTAGVGRDPLLAAGEQEPADGAEEPADDGGEVVWTYAVPGGDFDGDGLADVLTVEVGLYGRTVVARRGADGTELWRRSEGAVTDLYGFAGPDLTGDGADDIILWDLRYEASDWSGSCPPPPDESDCVEEYTATFTWTVGVVDGSDGTLQWQRETDGSVTRREEQTYQEDPVEGSRWTWTIQYDATGDLLLPVVSVDHDGDGLPDLLLERIDAVDYDYSTEYETVGPDLPVVGHAAESDSQEISLALDSAVEIVAGATGGAVAEIGSTGIPAEPWALPLGGDATGDGIGDVVVRWFESGTGSSECTRLVGLETPATCDSTQTSEYGRTVEVRDATDLTVVWSRDFGLGEWAVPSGRDHTGDGVPDLLYEGFDAAGVISGVDGGDAWRRSFDGFPSLLPMDDLDGDGTSDVLLSLSRFEATTGERQLDLERLTGPSGAVLAETTHDRGDDGYALVATGPDGDGDGTGDVLVDIWTIEDDGEDRTQRRTLTFERGADGAPLWTTDDTARLLWDAADLNGDGADELTFARFEEPTGSFEAVDVAQGSLLWVLDEVAFFFPALIDDVDGDGGADLLEDVLSDGPEPTLGVNVRRGADLEVLWFAGG